MKTNIPAPQYKGYRFLPEMISHCVWLYFRFSRSYRDIEELLAERGIVLTYETVRQWCLKLGRTYANELRRHRPRCGDKWHLDEVFLTINGKRHSLWRAVDQQGNVLDILVQSRRDKRAEKPVFPQAAQRAEVRATRDQNLQAGQLCRSQMGDSTRRGASSAQRAQPSSGKLPPID